MPRALFSTIAATLLTTGLSLAQVTATWAEYGSGCPGTGAGLGQNHLMPAFANTGWGSGNAIPFGWSPNTFQQFFQGTEMPTPFTMAAMTLRVPHTGPVGTAVAIDMDVKVGYTTRWSGTISSTFSANWDVAPPVQVLPRTIVNFPDAVNATSYTEVLLTIPWPTTFAWTPAPGRNFLVEIKIYGNSAGSGIIGYPLDNTIGTIGQWGTPETATTANGGAPRAFGPAIGFVEWTNTATPHLYSTSTPQIGNTFRVRVAQAPPSAAVLMLMGLSSATWNGNPLPYSLAQYGAPGCNLLLDPFDTRVLFANTTGYTSAVYSIPNNIYALGLHFYDQAFPVDALANPLGLSASNGGVGVLGNQ